MRLTPPLRCTPVVIGLLVLAGAPAAAHESAAAPSVWWTLWVWEPNTVGALIVTGALYIAGVTRLWRAAGVGAGVRRAEAAAYAAGWLTLVIALLSPVHPLGQLLFSVHMSQHELLMLVAAPLLVLGRPLVAWLWALPRAWRPATRAALRVTPLRVIWRLLTLPLVAWLVHALALWIWHVPALFEATLTSALVHAAQHVSFLGSALLFWWALIGSRGALGYGAAVLYLFTTSMHSGLLGALLTLARTLWYPSYAATAPAWGLTGLEDQQLGGLVMWIPAGLLYLIAALALTAGWLRESSRRAEQALARGVA